MENKKAKKRSMTVEVCQRLARNKMAMLGLAILPSRLKTEMELLKDAILNGRKIADIEAIEKHARWADSFLAGYEQVTKENIDAILQKEIGLVFGKVLEDAGVFKRDEAGRAAFRRFTDSL